MISSFLRKSLTYFFSSLAVITITFFFLHMIPGDPFTREMTLPQETIQSLRSHYGLDQPLHIQYFSYLYHMLFFDFGPSLNYEGRAVITLIREALPLSFTLGAFSIIASLICGCTLGLFLAKRAPNQEKTPIFTTLGLCIPTFVLAPFLQYFFALKWPIFPIGRCDHALSIVLPLVTLSFLPTFQIARIVHYSIVAILKEEYIETARAKGMTEKEIWKRHVLKNASLPVLSYLVPLTSYLFMGSFVVERTFSLPGLGQLMVTSIESRDYSSVMGLVVVYCVVLFSVEWIVGTIQSLVDPRVCA